MDKELVAFHAESEEIFKTQPPKDGAAHGFVDQFKL